MYVAGRSSTVGRCVGKRNDLSLFIGHFNSVNVAKKARVVRSNYGLDKDVRTGLVQLLTAPKGTKKRKVSEVSLVVEAGVSSRTLQPLVKILGNVPTENARGRAQSR